MSLRAEALAWLRSRDRSTEELVRVSKLYSSDESWSHAPAWWFEFPEDVILDSPDTHINLLCQAEDAAGAFFHLRVPIRFLLRNHEALGFRAAPSRYSLFLSAERDDRFRELRGPGRVDFSQFQVVAPGG